MIINHYSADELHAAFGIEMSGVPGAAAGAGWGRVPPGGSSTAHQHDEIEVFVVLRGQGEVLVDGARHPVVPGALCQFEPFETHVIANTGEQELVFFDLYWRDPAAAVRHAAPAAERRRFHERPLFVFSTPPTPNGDLHLGHLSGPYLGADVFVRHQRMLGARAWHLTGSDDYQSYVVECAGREGREPAETAAHYSAEILETLRLMDIEPDQYTTTDRAPGYREGLRDYFSRVLGSGAVTARPTPALFDEASGAYLYEVDVSGGCPGCGQGTNGNICEDCGEPNVCADLAEPRANGGAGPVRRGEQTRFTLPLHDFAKEVSDHHRLGRVPARLRELAERVFARRSLDIPLTHPAGWGVPPAETDVTDQVIWVWPEMSYGFLHGIGALGSRLGEDWNAERPEQDWKIVHFFGYDNSFYHAILYPVLYRLAHPGWNPDVDYHLNEFYLLDHAKFSTSRRHAVWGKDILDARTVDAVRLFLAATRPESYRTNFDPDEYARFVERTLNGGWHDWLTGLGRRIRDDFDGAVPDAGVWTPEHTAFLGRLELRRSAISAALGQDGFALNRAMAELTGLVEDVRGFAAAEAPTAGAEAWHDEARTALALELAAARLLARTVAPIAPRFAARLAAALGDPAPAHWPGTVELVPPGTRVELAALAPFRGTPDDADADADAPAHGAGEPAHV